MYCHGHSNELPRTSLLMLVTSSLMMASSVWRAFLRTPTFWSLVLLLNIGTIRPSTDSGWRGRGGREGGGEGEGGREEGGRRQKVVREGEREGERGREGGEEGERGREGGREGGREKWKKKIHIEVLGH